MENGNSYMSIPYEIRAGQMSLQYPFTRLKLTNYDTIIQLEKLNTITMLDMHQIVFKDNEETIQALFETTLTAVPSTILILINQEEILSRNVRKYYTSSDDSEETTEGEKDSVEETEVDEDSEVTEDEDGEESEKIIFEDSKESDEVSEESDEVLSVGSESSDDSCAQWRERRKTLLKIPYCIWLSDLIFGSKKRRIRYRKQAHSPYHTDYYLYYNLCDIGPTVLKTFKNSNKLLLNYVPPTVITLHEKGYVMYTQPHFTIKSNLEYIVKIGNSVK